jgi:hypothetical protein
MNETTGSRFRFYLPDARLLEESEIANLPPEKKSAAETGGQGLWLEIACPDASCIDDQGNIHIPAQGVEAKQKGTFLKLFCPEGSCEVIRPTDLP